MNKPNLRTKAVDQLVELFVRISLAQDEALLHDEIGKFNKLYDQKTAVTDELKARSGDQRQALLVLYNHTNAQVRLNAAKSTLAVAPQEARLALQKIASSQEYPQAGDAGMSLWNLDRGIFKPA